MQHFMVVVDNYFDRAFGNEIYLAECERERQHKSSGKLSASQLASPLQWQLLRAASVGGDPLDDYALRLFTRGRQIEEFVLSQLPNVLDKQVAVEYRNVVGYVDAIVDGSLSDFPAQEKRVLEIKSVSNAKFKRVRANGFDKSWLLQAALYALALGLPKFTIAVVAADDYRIMSHIYVAADFQAEIDAIIDTFDAWRASGRIPAFEPKEAWHANPKYNKYPQWAALTEDEATALYQSLTNK